MQPHCNGVERLNSFALVVYIPDPLGSFLDRLRRELEPNSLSPRAHVTILPPRQLSTPSCSPSAIECVRSHMLDVAPFPISIGTVEVFPGTNVVYLSIGEGFDQLRSLHTGLNDEELACLERYPYHPHVTLVQNLTAEHAAEVAREASTRWDAYRGEREFQADVVTFVQETTDKRWLDLESMSLTAAPVHHGR